MKALYERSRELFTAGEREPDLQKGLALRGYGDWNLDNVYAFVYEAAADFPVSGQHEFVDAVRHADFASLLNTPLSA